VLPACAVCLTRVCRHGDGARWGKRLPSRLVALFAFNKFSSSSFLFWLLTSFWAFHKLMHLTFILSS
jgi:hypothetical protein